MTSAMESVRRPKRLYECIICFTARGLLGNCDMFRNTVRTLHSALVFPRRTRVLSEALREILPADASVLDVGTGDGTIAKMCMQVRSDIRIEGVDVHPRPNPQIPVTIFDGNTLPFRDASFDVVSFIDVLHHSADMVRLLLEAARVARAHVVIKDHFAETALDHSVLRLMDWVGNAPHGVTLPFNYISRPQWTTMFVQAGMEVDRMQTDLPLYPVPFHWVFGRGLHFLARLRTMRQGWRIGTR
jgi:SAM-dependent methyltransferase